MPELDKKRKALLARLLAKEGFGDAESSRIAARTSREPAPLSFAQQRLWLLDQMAPSGPPAYNMPAAYIIDGDLDIAALDDAFHRLLQRHHVLRTRITVINGDPRQEVVDDARVTMVLRDVSRARDPLATFTADAEVLARTPFDLSTAPLIRVTLARLGPARHGLAVVLHHIVADGWSLPILMREVMASYGDARQQRATPLPPLSIQYADYAEWHRAHVASSEMAPHRAFWQRAFAEPAPTLDLPSDGARPAERRFHGAEVRHRFDADVAAGINAVARSEGASVFMTLLTLVNVLLARHSGQRDIVVGSPIAGRVRPELADQIGFYVNMLPLRTTIDDSEGFSTLLGRVARSTGEALEHEIYPFDQLVHELHLDRDLGRSPLFDVVVVVDKAGDAVLGFEGLSVRPIDLPRISSKFDLTFHFVEFDDHLDLTIEYSTDLYKRDRIERLTQHLEQLMRAVVRAPTAAVGRLPLLSTGERAELLTWSAEKSSAPYRASIVERVEAQATRQPTAVAVTCGADHLTYAELNQRANQVARRLVARGVVAESRVGVCFDRSLDLVVAILGVLKAGGAYVPLDPSYPAERLQYLMADSGLQVVVANGKDAIAHLHGWNGVVLDTTSSECARASGKNLNVALQPEQAAYVIYTSGSTGQPKGCVVTHGNLARLMTSTEQWFEFNERDVWTLFHSYAFDFSVWELWGALAYGGRLVVVPYWISRAPDAFLDLLSREQVTVLNQTPSAFRELVRVDGQSSQPLALRYVIFGGEALDIAALEPWFAAHGDSSPQLVNMYGITETTVHVTYRPVTLADVESRAGSVIGVPIPDLSIYLLDESLEPVPVGVSGEMYVGGEGVCRGYLGRPSLTAERFIPNPFSTHAGSRLYRSGDLGRWTTTGDIEYLGRADNQVKIRGFRIETGEIEAALRLLPGVDDAIVIARAHAGAKQLVAYVVSANIALDTSALRSALEQSLPDYMVPAHVIRIDARPLTAHGKLDARALPEPEGVVHTAFAAPRTDEERALSEIWAEALSVARVGIDDNYFELGGDSILALRVIASARGRGVNFGIRDLYQRRTIRSLISGSDVAVDTAPTSHGVAPFALIADADRALIPSDAEDAYPLSRLQAGMFFHSALDPESAIFHDIFSYRLRMPFDEQAFRHAATELSARHPVLRTSFHWDPYAEPLQVVWKHAPIPVLVVDLRTIASAEHDSIIAQWLETEKQQKFDPAKAPPFHLHLHVRADDEVQLTADFHHAILDGWSFATLMSELVAHYLDICRGDAQAPPAPHGRFSEFIALENQAAQSNESRAFWSQQVADLPATRVPRWSHTPLGTGAASHEVTLNAGAELQALAQRIGVPVKSVCMAAHAAVLSLLSGDRDVVTGLTTNGRPDSDDAAAMVGLFLNTVPFRLNVRRDSWRTLVERAFDAERELLEHRRFPLSEIKALAGGRELYDAGFNFVHFHTYKPIADRVDVLSVTAFEQTDYSLVANFSIDPRDGRLALRLSYDAAQFSATQIDLIGGYYERALAAIAATPDASWRQTAFLSRTERGRIENDFSRGPATTAPDWSLVSRFEAQAQRTPDHIAAVYLTRSLSYRELNERSNRVAHHLASLGIGPGDLVGISLPRSEWLLVALLGIVKSGAAYLPIDVSYPDDRVAYILDDSKTRIVISDGSRSGMNVVDIASHGDASNPAINIDRSSLAYVIYTSGSTGRPKGTMIAHGALAHYLAWAINAYRIVEGSRSIVHSSVSFDATITSLLTPLLIGGTVELVPDEHAVLALAEALAKDQDYGLVKITPAHLDLLRHELGSAGPRARVSAFVIGGEALLDSTLAWWRQVAPNARFINEYGPTETVVGCAVYEDRGANGQASVPIGRPIDRTHLYVLDDDLGFSPTGTAGEIFIGGAGVARGYLGRASLTAERFIPDPFAHEPDARMYRTGDLGRWREDGEMEYLGRNDFQVKVRGHRVELGEIEAVLSEHPSVDETAVVAKAVNGTHELIAFLVGRDLKLESVRAFATKRMPEPLVPSRFVVLASLPLTPNGKVDRTALLSIEAEALQSSTPFAPPRTDAENALAAIWESVLHKTRVGVSDDYFASGGDSLKALQVVSRAARDGWRLRVRDVFDYPTIAELAQHAGRDVVHAEQGVVTGDVSLTPIQHWFFEDHDGPYDHFNQSVSLKWRGTVDAPLLSRALTALADHHDALRLRFAQDAAGAWHQHHVLPAEVIDVVEASTAADADRLQQSLDISSGPLVRAAIFRQSGHDRVVIAIHHLVVDGVSWRVLLEDLDTAYQQLSHAQPVQLPPKTESFRDWSQRVHAYASSSAALSELTYWQSVVSSPVELPLDGAADDGALEVVVARLDVDRTETLFGAAHRAYRTQANDLLLTGLAMALETAFNTTQSLVTVEGHGRHDGLDADVSRTVGWFTSRYPVRLTLVDDDLRARIRRVKEELRQIPSRGFGYGVLRYLGTPTVAATLECRPAIGFNYLGRFDTDSSSPLFDITDDSTGAVVDPTWPRDHDIDIVATVFEGQLEVRVEATRGRFLAERVQQFADAYIASLRAIAEHCREQPGEPTPSDLTYSGLDIASFDYLLGAHALEADEVEDILPLSPMQEGFLFHSVFDASGAYFEQSAYRLNGRIDVALFEDAWNQLLARHHNLRVAFWHEDVPRPVQVVLRDRQTEFVFADWRKVDAEQQIEGLREYREDERRRGFDLAHDPLVRVALFQVGDARFDAVWGFPHLLLDGWSAGILLGELLTIYASLVGNTAAELPEPVPYRRYLQWLDRQDRVESAAFWRHYLDGYAETTSVPSEKRTAQHGHYQPLSVPWRLGIDETQQLKSLAAQLHVTLSTVVQTLWAALLSSYTERGDVVFGATVSGRPESLPGVERMVGLFINTVPVRMQCSVRESFNTIAKRMQVQALAAQEHASCPLAEIQAQSTLKSHLFDHILVFENYPLDQQLRELGSILKVESSDVFEQVHYDLGLLVADTDEHLEMRFIANSAVYPETRLWRVIGHFKELAREVLAHPDRPLRAHSILPAAERREIAAFNETTGAPRAGVTLVDLTNEQAARTPDAVAIVHGRERLTYAQLHSRADRLADVLRARGVGPETLVGVFLTRRTDLIVALLAVLKAGGAYVPLDPNYPADRISFLFDDAGMTLVLTETMLRSSIPRSDASVICVDAPLAVLPRVSTAQSPLRADNLAYVIYTSGSTGKPKGTAISHAAAAALVEWGRHTYAADELRGVLASTSVCFDLSVFEIFVTLSTGGAIVLAENALELPKLAAANEVTLVNTVPSAMAELVRNDGLPQSVRTVNLAGEPLSAALVDALYAVPTIRRVCDLYGPSEDTTYSTYALRERGGPETIGGPITHSHTEIHLLNTQLDPVPVGVVGELYISSDKLCRGYLHRPDLTAERFMPNPHSASGGRMYRSGDIARYREDGRIEFLGRIDHQVKIRGFRIELGEIESALTATGWTLDTAVVAREDVPGDKFIAAYIVRTSDAPVDVAAYRDALSKKLPDYMVPASFVFIDRLPQTPNGKLDRRALPMPDAVTAASASADALPRTALETVLAEIWRDALNVDHVGIFDNFFDHGGHSLKAARMVSRARQEHGLDLSLRDLFTYPTVAGLAEQIASRQHVEGAAIPVIAAADNYEMSYGQRRLWVLEQLRGDGPSAYNVPAAFLLRGTLDADALERAIRAVIQRHEILRTRIVTVNGEPRQDVLPTVDFHIDRSDLSGIAEPTQRFDEQVRRSAHAPFDLAHAPLLRVSLTRLGLKTHGLIVVLHHIVTDGWSIPILMRELMRGYSDALDGRTLEGPSLRVQYKDYAAWQRALVDGHDISVHRDYWRGVFAETPAALELPTDVARAPIQTFEGSQHRLELSAGAAAQVRALASAHGASVFMTLLAAMNVLLGRMSGQSDITVGTPMAGRAHPDLNDQIGYYVNTVPLRTTLVNGESFHALLDRTRDVVSGAFEHQAYPFDRLVDDLDIARDMSRSPLFDVMIAMENDADSDFALANLQIEPLALDYRISKFDVTTTFRERGEGHGIEVVFEYNTALFTAQTMARIGRRFESLVHGIVQQPDEAIEQLPVLPADELSAVSDEWNWESLDRARGKGLATLFEEQVARTPNAAAVSFANRTFTYRELNDRANAVAATLVGFTVRPEEPVGLMVHASDWLVVGMLGILKAGCAYVTLDPSYPRERNVWVLDDAAIRIVVKTGDVDVIRDGLQFVDPTTTAAAAAPAHNRGTDESLAYVLYTSGSTGRPKGVEVPHRGVVNLLADMQRRAPIRSGDQCALWTSASFDVSAYEIFSALLAGGCLHVATEAMRGQPRTYFEWIAKGRIASAYIAPFQLSEFRDFLLSARTPLSLSRLLVGVEPIDEHLLASIRRLVPGLRIINGYGPTEASICATLYDVPDTAASRITPIGRAVANTGTYVVDRELQPVGFGVIGEIVLAGDGLARGYHRNAAATADAFLPSPFGPEGMRLYRTGDLGYRLTDGNIVFAGRTDHQVKIRGHRVEVAEVERALRGHDLVADTAVIAAAAGATKELIAFLVPHSAEPSIESLRAFLADHLPEYMIPSRFVVLEEMPLTPSGKVDRRALSTQDGRQLRMESGYVAPRNHRETALANVWRNVLGADRVGINDNYFSLGGDSIKAIQIASRASADGLSLTIRDIFSHPTVAELAIAATDRTRVIPQGPVTGTAQLTAIQEWFFGDNTGPFSHFNQAVLLRWNGSVNEETLRLAGAALLEQHDALRSTFTRNDAGQWTQTISADADIAWTVADLSDLPKHEAVARMERQADALHASLSLEDGSLVAGAIFRLPGEDRVLLVVHHLVIDGVSWRILLEDLDAAYRQLRDGDTVVLPPKTDSLIAWADAVHGHAQSADVRAERPYWTGICAQSAGATALDTIAGERRTLTATLAANDTRLLLSSAKTIGASDTVTLLLAALAQTLRGEFGNARTTIDLEGHGREATLADLDIARTVGWFTSLYPFLLDAGESSSDIRATIDTVHHALRRVPNRGVGYGLLRYIANDEDASALKYRADVGFNYLGEFSANPDGGVFGFAPESSGRSVDPRWRHAHALDVSAHVESQRFHLALTFDDLRIRPTQAQQWLDAFVGSLKEIVALIESESAEFSALLTQHGLTQHDVEGTCALSPMQGGMLFNSLFDADSSAYFEQIAYRINGDLAPAAFEASWNALLARHANLRASIWHKHAPRPVVVIRRHQRVDVRLEDWTTISTDEQAQRLSDFRIADRRRGFDLERDPLMRFGLFRTGKQRWEIVWSYPHLLLDGWSTGILLSEFVSAYAGELSALPASAPYTQYLDWIAAQDHTAALERWQQRLDGYDELASISPDVTLSAPSSSKRETLAWTMPADTLRQLERLGVEHGVTMNTIVQTMWGVLLGRLTDRRDVVFGSTVSGRPEELTGVENMVGLFINTLPVRVQWRESESFTDTARRLQQESIAAQADGFVPLAEIQSASAVRGPLFDHLVIFENYPLNERVRQIGEDSDEWDIEAVDVFEETHYPLVLAVAPADGELHFRCAHNPSVYSADRIAELKQQWDVLIASVVSAADQPVRALSVLTVESEAEVLLFARATRGSGAPETLNELLNARLNENPDAIAVSFGASHLTVRELHERASYVAAALKRAGVSTDSPVGLCLPRSLDLGVAMLGIVRAGGAYVPIDADYPSTRVNFMLADSHATVVITMRGLVADDVAPDVRRVFIEDIAAATDESTSPAQPTSLAYVLYTSGSTGTPKGVGIPHQALTNHMRWMAREFPLLADDRVLQKTPFSFDASVWEFWAPLVDGGTLIVAEPGVHQDPKLLTDVIAREHITVLQLVPTLLHALLDEPAFRACTSLRRVFVGGEALSPDLRQRFFNALPSARLINLYGPTETTIDSTWFECRPDDAHSSVPIGVPVDGLIAYVFDERMESTAIGVWGELCIGGAGVGRGYLERPDLTAERFCPDPVSGVAGARMYRTGDRARWRTDGVLEYGGRADDQVKLRGFRIELGEVEAALRHLDGVSDAAALVTANGTELSAYVAVHGAAPTTAELRQSLREHGLPAQMIPGRIAFLDVLPRTTSGKLDRRALLMNRSTTDQDAPARVLPRSDSETKMAAIWARALQLPEISITDNFFDLGGHSLTAARVAAQASRDLSMNVSVRDVFTYPTIAELSEYLTAVAWASSSRPTEKSSDDTHEDVTL